MIVKSVTTLTEFYSVTEVLKKIKYKNYYIDVLSNNGKVLIMTQ